MPEEMLEAVKKAISGSPERKFVETVELAVNLKEVDLKNPKNRLNEEVILPKGRGKDIKVAIFANSELAEKSKGIADLIITPDKIDEYAKKKPEARKMVNQIDYFLSEAPLMPTIGKTLGVILGPRGKMPRPVPPNIDPTNIVKNVKNTVKIKTKDRKTFHVPVGVRTMSPEDLVKNIEVVMTRIESKLERGKQNIQSVYVKTSMGPAVRLM
jgi:large subunit ribosomal protein L1